MGPGYVAAPSRAADTLWGSDAVPIYALDYAAPAIDPQAFVHPDAVVIGAEGLGGWPAAIAAGPGPGPGLAE